jgi:hypothetical protein
LELVAIGDIMWETLYRPEFYKRKFIGVGSSEASLALLFKSHFLEESKKDDWNMLISKCLD